MYTQPTPSSRNYFIKIFSKKLKGFCLLLFSKNIHPIRIAICFLLLLFKTIPSAFGQANFCQANLVVESNGNIRSTPLDGTYYSMLITNTGLTAVTYLLTTVNKNNMCNNPDQSNTSSNVVINTDFIDPDKNAITEITIAPGQVVNFYTHITVPVGTPIEKWSCTNVIATSKECIDYNVQTMLHTYIINPNKD